MAFVLTCINLNTYLINDDVTHLNFILILVADYSVTEVAMIGLLLEYFRIIMNSSVTVHIFRPQNMHDYAVRYTSKHAAVKIEIGSNSAIMFNNFIEGMLKEMCIFYIMTKLMVPVKSAARKLHPDLTWTVFMSFDSTENGSDVAEALESGDFVVELAHLDSGTTLVLSSFTDNKRHMMNHLTVELNEGLVPGVR